MIGTCEFQHAMDGYWSIHTTGNGKQAHLSHLKTDNLGEGTLLRGDFSVVHAQNAGTTVITTVGLDPFVTELGLVLAESNAGNFALVVLVSKSSEGTPSTSNVQQAIVGLEVELLANYGQLVILELLKAFLFFDIQNNTRGINHAGAEEPLVEVIASCAWAQTPG